MSSGNTGPAIILVEPQLGENIGAVARAMLNFGLADLRLVAPRDGWPNPAAVAMAAGATAVLDAASVHPTIDEAVADLQDIYATTARTREMSKATASPREAAASIAREREAGTSCGILFGGERSGLSNADVVLAQTIIHIPVNPSFGSLNLAQAVLLVAYECFLAAVPAHATSPEPSDPAATSAERLGLFEHLEAELHASGFFYPPEKSELMTQNIRNIFQRGPLTQQDVQTLRGIIKALSRGRPPRK